MHKIRSRWALIAATMLLFLAAGAVWAALITPRFRSTALVGGADSSGDVNQVAESAELIANVRAQVSSTHGDEVGLSVLLGTKPRGASTVEIYADAESAELAQDVARTYADLIAAELDSTTLQAPASFPTAPASPNLRRVALLTGMGGALVGIAASVAIPVPTQLAATGLVVATPGDPGERSEPRSQAPVRAPGAFADLVSDARPADAPTALLAPRIDPGRVRTATRRTGEMPRVVELPPRQQAQGT